MLASAGFGYTIATGRLFCDFSDFHEQAEELLGRPIMTHEFGIPETWTELCNTFEEKVREELAR